MSDQITVLNIREFLAGREDMNGEDELNTLLSY